MATRRTAAKKTVRKASKTDDRADLASKAASAITEAISRSSKGKLGKGADGKITVHVHIGDVIMMGFDEAVDAEEWGMRENNTEIIGGKTAKGRKSQGLDADAQAEKNRKITRRVNFRKGSLQLEATENSEPARKSPARKRPATKKKPATRKTASRTKRVSRK